MGNLNLFALNFHLAAALYFPFPPGKNAVRNEKRPPLLLLLLLLPIGTERDAQVWEKKEKGIFPLLCDVCGGLFVRSGGGLGDLYRGGG